jgi:DNA-binding GntR family transcriptional regulator
MVGIIMSKAYEKIYNIIRKQILDEKNKDMEQLPPERILCETYGVSRITIRQALKMLQDQGLIERLPGKGTYIKRGQEKKISVFDSSYERAFENIMPKITRKVCAWAIVEPPQAIAQTLGLLKSEGCLTFERVDCQSDCRRIRRIVGGRICDER